MEYLDYDEYDDKEVHKAQEGSLQGGVLGRCQRIPVVLNYVLRTSACANNHTKSRMAARSRFTSRHRM